MSESTRKILLSTRIMRGLSGKVILLRHNILALKAAGWDVSMFAEKIDARMMQSMGAEAISLWNKGFTKSYKLKRFLHKHERLARNGGFDLVVGHGETLYQDVLHIHNARHMEYEILKGKPLLPGEKSTGDIQAEQVMQKRYRRLVANSHVMKNDFVSRFGADPDYIDVVYPGYDPQRFFPARDNAASRELRASLGAENDILVGLVTSGKLNQRGADLFIPALARLPAALAARIKVIIVAKDNLEPYKQQAAEAGLTGKIRFLDPRPDVEVFYNALDIYINPARVEMFGMALLEAMACGVPSITTRGLVGAAEIYSDDMAAGLMDAATVEALTVVLQRLIENDALRQQLGQQCAQAALSHSWASNTRQHIEIYERVLAEKQAEAA